MVILGLFSLGCVSPSWKNKVSCMSVRSVLYIILNQNSMRKYNIFAPRTDSCPAGFRKLWHLLWNHFSNLICCSKENTRTLVICLFFFDYIIEWCVSWLWQIISCALQNIQSTNWQTMRFKPPPPNSDIGWRVEFRPMEVRKTSIWTRAHFLLSGKVPGILPSSIKLLLLVLCFLPFDLLDASEVDSSI